MIKKFKNDREYLEWCRKHPDWYVLNSNRSFSPISLVIHRATCPKITEITGHYSFGCFTEKDYIKVSAEDIRPLENWVFEERKKKGKFDGLARKCAACMGM